MKTSIMDKTIPEQPSKRFEHPDHKIFREGMKILVNKIKSEPNYIETWKSIIAKAIKDEIDQCGYEEGKVSFDQVIVPTLASIAADRVLIYLYNSLPK